MSDETRHVIEHFPDMAGSIKQCLSDSRNFRSLCEDYDLAAEALRYWQRADAPQAPQRIEEYRNLLDELEAEIRSEIARLTGS